MLTTPTLEQQAIFVNIIYVITETDEQFRMFKGSAILLANYEKAPIPQFVRVTDGHQLYGLRDTTVHVIGKAKVARHKEVIPPMVSSGRIKLRVMTIGRFHKLVDTCEELTKIIKANKDKEGGDAT